MRRFSQRTQLVTLSDINVTPLLDLAFVLLIIFAITAPLLEQSIQLRLPEASGQPIRPDSRDVMTVEVSVRGEYYLKGQRLSGLPELEAGLVAEYRRNPEMIVRIRADGSGMYQLPVNIIEICRRNGITKFDLATDADR